MRMTLEQMIKTLIDKGHNRMYAEAAAQRDRDALNLELAMSRPTGTLECDICRRKFTVLGMKYHYHPCE